MLVIEIFLFLLYVKEWIRRLTKNLNKFIVLKHILDDTFKLVQRHQPDHPKLPILKRTYDLVLRGKDIKTNETDRAPSSEDRPNKKTSRSQDAGTDSSHSQAQHKATTSEARDAIADSSAHEAPDEPIASGAKHAEDDCSANQAQNPATEDTADMTNSKEQAEEDDCSANQAQNPGTEEMADVQTPKNKLKKKNKQPKKVAV